MLLKSYGGINARPFPPPLLFKTRPAWFDYCHRPSLTICFSLTILTHCIRVKSDLLMCIKYHVIVCIGTRLHDLLKNSYINTAMVTILLNSEGL